MKRKLKTNDVTVMCVTFYIAILFLTGCAGTIHTRGNPNGSSFGKPIYAAVAEDFRVTFNGCGGGPGWTKDFNMLKPFSFPMDFLFDSVFLPIDIIAWCAGCDKYDGAKPQEKKQKKDNSKLVVWSTKEKKIIQPSRSENDENVKNDDPNSVE